MKRKCLTLNKPIYVGFTVFEISKLAMYVFHIDFMKKIFNDFKLLFIDLDSLCYEKFYEHREYFDLRYYFKNSKYFCNNNKKVLCR